MVNENTKPGPFASWQVFVATGFGFGLWTPVAPGTVGAIQGVPLAVLIAQVPAVGVVSAEFFQAVIIAALVLVGIPICSSAQRTLGGKDPSEVIWDELATVPIVFFLIPAPLMLHPGVLLVGFALHRLFDITKPPPCRWLENLQSGLGIMADDVAAAVYAAIVMHLLLWWGVWSA